MRVRSETDREILRLAVPAFLALVAEPLFLLGDAAVVGRLGTTELAGLGIAAVVLQTAVGLCVFLAYGTTASVARRLGAGDLRGALAQGVDGLWLAVGGPVLGSTGSWAHLRIVGAGRTRPAGGLCPELGTSCGKCASRSIVDKPLGRRRGDREMNAPTTPQFLLHRWG